MEQVPQRYVRRKLDELHPHPSNPRQGDVGAIHESIEANGFYGAVIVQKSTGYVLAGNHRMQAAAHAGAKSLPVIEVDVDDATATRILLADNRTNDVATYDQDALAGLLRSLAEDGGLAGSGYDGDDVDALLADIAQTTPQQHHEYSSKIESPIYEPTGTMPPVSALAETATRDELLAAITAAALDHEVSEFLTLAAHRHTRFDYETIANYYAHAAPEVQRLMEASALVVIDYGQAVERGFVRLHQSIDGIFHEDHPDA